MTSAFNTSSSLGSGSSGVRVASSDPHFVCLGSGRLSTGVTIHQIPVGNLTIGSAESCDIILKGPGILEHHCTIARTDSGDVLLTPSSLNSRVLIDGLAICDEHCLQQGSMLTIGDSNCLRFNNPSKAELLKKTAEMNGKVAIITTNGNTNNNNNESNVKFIKKQFETNSKNFTENNVPKILNNSGDKKMNNLKAKTNEFYPKLGNLKIYPISSPTSGPDVNANDVTKVTNKDPDEELKKLEEILQLCIEYDQSNGSTSNSQNGTMERNKNSPSPHQNRIKTNGSLPKNFHTKDSNYFFNNLYENVCSNDLSPPDKKYDSDGSDTPKKTHYYTPQSPRTRIKTFIPSPQQSRTSPVPDIIKSQEASDVFVEQSVKNDYEMLIKTFEDKFRMEIQNIQNYSGNGGEYSSQAPVPTKTKAEPEMLPSKKTELEPNVKSDLEETLNELKKLKVEIVSRIRELKIEISDLQRQENEMFHEFDMEKSLVAAEMTTESEKLTDLEAKLVRLRQQMKKMELQRLSNQTSQEVQQIKLKNSIQMKQNEIDAIEKQIMECQKENQDVSELEDQLNSTTEALENEQKSFEDLEFHILEEEAEWQSFTEDFHQKVEKLTKLVDEKRDEIETLEQTKQQNESVTLEEQKSLELKLVQLKNTLEIEREKLRNIDKKLLNNENTYENKDNSDDEDDDEEMEKKMLNFSNTSNMSQSLFMDTNDLLTSQTKPENSTAKKSENLMSKSFNENWFLNNKNIEIPAFNFLDTLLNDSTDSKKHNTSTSTPKKRLSHDNKFNFSFDENLLRMSSPTKNKVLQEANRTPSQDDIDRISKVTASAPISSLASANQNIRKSFEALEQNRKNFLASQGTNVIDNERHKMEMLKKRSSDAARAEYQRLIEMRESQEKELDNGSVERDIVIEGYAECIDSKHGNLLVTSVKRTTYSSHNRHSNPEFLQNQEAKSLVSVNPAINNGNSLVKQQQYSTSNIELVNSFGTTSSVDTSRASGSSEKENDVKNQNPDVGLRAGVKRNMPKSQRPLTRYLPILSADLNLRQHIETAGHQLQLCPHVIINETSCRGYLNKMGAKFGGWSKRWFVFDRERNVLLYFSDKSEKKPRGGAYFAAINEVYLDHSTTSKFGRNNFCTFIVKTKKRSYHLQAPSAAAARIWIDVIITGAQGNLFDY